MKTATEILNEYLGEYTTTGTREEKILAAMEAYKNQPISEGEIAKIAKEKYPFNNSKAHVVIMAEREAFIAGASLNNNGSGMDIQTLVDFWYFCFNNKTFTNLHDLANEYLKNESL